MRCHVRGVIFGRLSIMEDARLDVLASHLDGGRPASGAAAGATPEYDLLIVGGHICDPSTGVDGISDVAVKGGRVAAVGPGLAAGGASAAEIFDATGLIVTPGLVDAHVHVRLHTQPTTLHINRPPTGS